MMVVPSVGGNHMHRSNFPPPPPTRPRLLARSRGVPLPGLLGALLWDVMAATLSARKSVTGGEWANRAMGNPLCRGVQVRDVLECAGVKAGAVQARFNGLDTGVVPQTPDFIKSLDIDRARDGEVMIAYAMNGEPLPLLNGFPLRLVVPGWYATYWVKMLDDIEVLDKPDDNFWMTKASLIPATPFAN